MAFASFCWWPFASVALLVEFESLPRLASMRSIFWVKLQSAAAYPSRAELPVTSLATAAGAAGELLCTCVSQGHGDCMADVTVMAAGIETMCGDILKADWSAYDVVYAASTCMSPTLCLLPSPPPLPPMSRIWLLRLVT